MKFIILWNWNFLQFNFINLLKVPKNSINIYAILPAKNTYKILVLCVILWCRFSFNFLKNASLVGMGRSVIRNVPDVTSEIVTASAENADDTNAALTSMDASVIQRVLKTAWYVTNRPDIAKSVTLI